MDASLALQYAVIAIAVAASAWVVAKKLFPNAVRGARMAIAVRLVRESRPPWLRALGKRIAPAPASAGKDCGGCDACDPPPRCR